MNFMEMVRLLEQDERGASAGEEVCTYRLLEMERLRDLVSRATPEQRRIRQESYFHRDIALRSRLGQGYHDRGEAHLFAAGELNDADRKFIARQMPMPARILSVAEKRLAPGETWDVSVRAQHWGKDDKQDCFAIVNVGTLVLGKDSRLLVRGNLLSLVCQRVISDEGTVEVGPTPYSPDDQRGPMIGVDGRRGEDGRSGEDGRELSLLNSLLGPVVPEGLEARSLDGTAGADGSEGGDAGHGRGGGMCKLAEITLYELQGTLTVFAQAGAGGAGGRGGDGGAGGAGGDGARGCYAVGAEIVGGRGGNGGRGGDAGCGGNGGHGGLSSNIYINLPKRDAPRLRCISLPSQAGRGGRGGMGGRGGDAGGGGRYTSSPHILDGPPGSRGASGVVGKPGKDGRSRPAPWIFVNEHPHQGERTWISTNVPQSSATPAVVSTPERPFDPR